jgi:hypothetical protein
MDLDEITPHALALPKTERVRLRGRINRSLRSKEGEWTPVEIAHLASGLTAAEIATRTGRSLDSVYHARVRFGVAKRKPRKGE